MVPRLVYIIMALTLFSLTSCKKRIASAPPPPPPPVEALTTPAPAPVVSITADRTAIEQGEKITLEWKSENATSVSLSGIGDVESNGRIEVSPEQPTTYTVTATGPGGTASDTVRITVTAPAREPEPSVPPSASVDSLAVDFNNSVEDVYFDYDRADVRFDQRPKLDRLIQWLTRNPGARVVIEGHCDERGSQEYNLALGDRRASNVRSYIVDAGISDERLRHISYGEERPMCMDQSESCWTRNRRAHFVLADTP